MPCIPMQIKPNKGLSRQGTGPALSFTERAAMSSLFLHRISVVCVNLSCLTHNAMDTVGRCPHQPCAISKIATPIHNSFSMVEPSPDSSSILPKMAAHPCGLLSDPQNACGLNSQSLWIPLLPKPAPLHHSGIPGKWSLELECRAVP